jgi:hypothetical protein
MEMGASTGPPSKPPALGDGPAQPGRPSVWHIGMGASKGPGG